jgi:hypothetical protein
MKYNFEAVLACFDQGKLWHYHFSIPEHIWRELLPNGKRVIVEINNDVTYPCALMNDGLGGYFININNNFRKKLKIQKGSFVTIKINSDTSTYGMPMCEELEELLVQDEEGRQYFNALQPGKQRSLIHLINKIKSAEIRLIKSVAILNYLKSSNGSFDYPALQQALRKNNLYP